MFCLSNRLSSPALEQYCKKFHLQICPEFTFSASLPAVPSVRLISSVQGDSSGRLTGLVLTGLAFYYA